MEVLTCPLLADGKEAGLDCLGVGETVESEVTCLFGSKKYRVKLGRLSLYKNYSAFSLLAESILTYYQ